MINPCFYYYLIKPQPQELHLRATPKGNVKGFVLAVQQNQQNVKGQLWMIKPADKKDTYHIFNCQSGLVLEVGKDNGVDLHHYRNKDSQKFRFTSISIQKQEYALSDYHKGSSLFIANKVLVSDMSKGDVDATWVLRRSIKDRIITESSIIQNQNSGYVLQVMNNAEKQYGQLNQSVWQGMFNQRWMIQKSKEFFILRNLKSNMVATIKGAKSKEGVQIVQEKQHQSHYRYQLWSLEPRGHRLYSIRLASQRQLFLGVKNYSKQQSSVMLLPQCNKHLWRIISPIF